MKPNRGEGMSGPELQSTALPEISPDSTEQHAEKIAAHPETAPSKQSAPPQLPATQVQLPDDISVPTIPVDDNQVNATNHAVDSKDADRIDKHWVDSAKNIISQTKDDPYKQKNEMSKVKANYIKQRFNKVVKADQEVA